MTVAGGGQHHLPPPHEASQQEPEDKVHEATHLTFFFPRPPAFGYTATAPPTQLVSTKFRGQEERDIKSLRRPPVRTAKQVYELGIADKESKREAGRAKAAKARAVRRSGTFGGGRW